jgi:hypothetical protein
MCIILWVPGSLSLSFPVTKNDDVLSTGITLLYSHAVVLCTFFVKRKVPVIRCGRKGGTIE